MEAARTAALDCGVPPEHIHLERFAYYPRRPVMRRITLWLLGTITSVVLLFSYHTSTSSAGAASPR